jgi:hypothetical protein
MNQTAPKGKNPQDFNPIEILSKSFKSKEVLLPCILGCLKMIDFGVWKCCTIYTWRCHILSFFPEIHLTNLAPNLPRLLQKIGRPAAAESTEIISYKRRF